MNPFDRLSTEARSALALAQAESERTASAYIGTEDLLLGLLGVDGCLAARVLAEDGIDLVAGRAIVATAPPGSAGMEIVRTGQVPTTRVRRVIGLAFDEALRMGLGIVTTGTLLVGLLQAEDGLASHLLRERGITVDSVRESLQRLAGAGISETA